MWYASDGGINKCDMYVRFTSRNESHRPENIIQGFADVGISTSNGNGTKEFYVSKHDTEKFFDFIGHDPVPGFAYKWAYKDRDRYERLKKEADEQYKTQTDERP